MKIKVNMGRAGGPADLRVGSEKIALLILEIFQKIIPPEPPSLMVKQITVTLENVKAQVMMRSGLEIDENDPDEEIFEACAIAEQRYPHLFRFALCKQKGSSKPEIGFQYTALLLS